MRLEPGAAANIAKCACLSTYMMIFSILLLLLLIVFVATLNKNLVEFYRKAKYTQTLSAFKNQEKCHEKARKKARKCMQEERVNKNQSSHLK